jgi:uncharacterized protein YndB with AHSA1/START domain
MSVQEASVSVRADPSTVFRCLTDPALVTRWIEGVVESRPLTTDGVRVGARSVEVVKTPGGQVELVSEITAVEPDRLLVVEITAPYGPCESRFVLAPEPGGTRVHQTMTLGYRGVFRLLSWLIDRSVRKKLNADLARLAALAEEIGRDG